MQHEPETHYTNIAISGLAGTGSTTLLRKLRAALEPQGWRGYSGGEFMKQYVPQGSQEGGHHSATAYSPDIDRQVDMGIRSQLATEHHLIVESWLAGFLAQGIPQVLKVLVTCSDDLDRAQRLAKRDDMSPEQAFVKAYQRLDDNMARWSQLYADEWNAWVLQPGTLAVECKVWFWNPRLYDLVIDTTAYNEEDTLELVLDKLPQADAVAASLALVK
ncbi:MAG: AAA family ATPase [Anaerolineae bacterium]|nr:AAA family ATPase [Anaerolineae bacterium]